MRTTISPKGDRRGVALTGRDADEILADARMVLADLSGLLKDHMAELRRAMDEDPDTESKKQIDARLRELAKSLNQVLDMESKAAARASLAPPLDLEAAREDIESRLDRLFAARSAGGVSEPPVAGDSGGDAIPVGSVGPSTASAGP